MNNDIYCETSGGNTGLPPCGILPGKFIGVYFIRERTTLTLAELADLETTLKEKVKLQNLNQRFYPIYGVDEDEDSSEDATITTSSRGYAEKTAPGSIQYSLQYHLDFCRTQQLARWDGFSGYCFFVDDNGNFWGKRNDDGTLSSLKLANVIANLRMAKAGTDITWNTMILNFGAPTKLFWLTLGVEKYSFDASEVEGIQDLTLKKVAATTFTVELSCGGGSIYSEYKTEIATLTAWKAKNAATGDAINITAVTENDAQMGYDLTFETAPPAGAKVRIDVNLESLSGIKGYEVKPLTYTV